MNEMLAAPAESLFVGDSTVDVTTGAAAGVPVCAVSWGLTDQVPLELARPAWLCDTPAEVEALLLRLTRS